MDRKVLHAYAEGDPDGRWLEVEVPPFRPLNDDDKKKLERPKTPSSIACSS